MVEIARNCSHNISTLHIKNRTSLDTIGVILLLMALHNYIEILLTHKTQSTQLVLNIYDRQHGDIYPLNYILSG